MRKFASSHHTRELGLKLSSLFRATRVLELSRLEERTDEMTTRNERRHFGFWFSTLTRLERSAASGVRL